MAHSTKYDNISKVMTLVNTVKLHEVQQSCHDSLHNDNDSP